MAIYFDWNALGENLYVQEFGLDGRILLQFILENQVKDSIELAHDKAKWRTFAHIV
jgi:hypothetical protein